MIFTVSLLALLLDRLLGEPRHHPLIWFGNLADRLEGRLNRGSNTRRWINGAVATLLVVAPPVCLLAWLQRALDGTVAQYAIDVAVLTFVIGWQSLKQHVAAIVEPLRSNDLPTARSQLALIVSRDTAALERRQISGSTIESVFENALDCVFACLFWYAVLGPTGALLHRLINTLDAMWGYRSARFDYFGAIPARLDDVLGWIPARLTALTCALCGNLPGALRCWREQGRQHTSPNGGIVMASGAGALGIRIGGPVPYAGVLRDKPWLGCGRAVRCADIKRATRLVERGLLLWLGVLGLLALYSWRGA